MEFAFKQRHIQPLEVTLSLANHFAGHVHAGEITLRKHAQHVAPPAADFQDAIVRLGGNHLANVA